MLESFEDEPHYYLHGYRNIFDALEDELEGLEAGDSFDVKLSPDEAFGEQSEKDLKQMPADQFPDRLDLEPGAGIPFEVEGREEPIVLYIDKVGDDTVYLDQNHPLSGRGLRFEGEIVEVREAEDEELDHGHPHTGQAHG